MSERVSLENWLNSICRFELPNKNKERFLIFCCWKKDSTLEYVNYGKMVETILTCCRSEYDNPFSLQIFDTEKECIVDWHSLIFIKDFR